MLSPALEVYERLDPYVCLKSYADDHGRTVSESGSKSLILDGYSDYMANNEAVRFVRQVRSSGEDAFELMNLGAKNIWRPTGDLSKYYKLLPWMILALNDDHDFGGEINDLKSAVKYLSIEEDIFVNGSLIKTSMKEEIFNKLISCIREKNHINSGNSSALLNSRKAKRRYRSSAEYIDKALAGNYSFLVVPVDLYYKAGAIKEVTREKFTSDRSSLFKRLKRGGRIPGLVGYICKSEEGKEVGVHLHVLLLIKGVRIADAEHFASIAGKEWVDIVGACSAFYLTSMDSDFRCKWFKPLFVRHDSFSSLKKIWMVIALLIKPDEYIKYTSEIGINSITLGHLGSSGSNKRGRPRNHSRGFLRGQIAEIERLAKEAPCE